MPDQAPSLFLLYVPATAAAGLAGAVRRDVAARPLRATFASVDTAALSEREAQAALSGEQQQRPVPLGRGSGTGAAPRVHEGKAGRARQRSLRQPVAGSPCACAGSVRGPVSVPPAGPAHAPRSRSEPSDTAGAPRMRSGRAPGLPALAVGRGQGCQPGLRRTGRWAARPQREALLGRAGGREALTTAAGGRE